MFDLPPSTPIICPVIHELLLVSKKFAKLAKEHSSLNEIVQLSMVYIKKY